MEGRLFIALISFHLCCATLPWVGNFNSYNSATEMDSSTAGNPSGQYMCYIYGQVPSTNKFSTWVELSPSYKNPGECLGNKGAKVTIDGTSIWQGNNVLRRTEMIANFPRSDENGIVYYKWSMMQPGTFTLSQYEHQLVFFENHPCDLKYGGQGGANLYFVFNGQTVWSKPFSNNVWFNFGLRVDYSGRTCALYYSTGSDPLVQVVSPTSVPGNSPNDFHVGILRVTSSSDNDPTKQSIYYSGVYAESTLTNNLGANCGTVTPVPPPNSPATTAIKTSATPKTSASPRTVAVTSNNNLKTSAVAQTTRDFAVQSSDFPAAITVIVYYGTSSSILFHVSLIAALLFALW